MNKKAYCSQAHTDILSKTLPFVLYPYKNESLHGYILRLENANNYPPGTILNMLKMHTSGLSSVNRPGLFVTGTIFDMHELSNIVQLPLNTIRKLTYSNLLNRIFRIEDVYPELLNSSTNFKICPICLQEKKIPIHFLFKGINVCFEHGIILVEKCHCGSNIILFSSGSKVYHCPRCETSYVDLKTSPANMNSDIIIKEKYMYNALNELINSNVGFIHENEDLKIGFEARLQYLINIKNISHTEFKLLYGTDASDLKNGYGLSNLSLLKVLELLHDFGLMPSQFRGIIPNSNYRKIINLNPNDNADNEKHYCPNIYCPNYKLLDKNNIKYYGKKKRKNGSKLIEEYCLTCGTRFIRNNITQSYDYNPGLRQYDIEKAQKRIEIWQSSLRSVCKEMIENRVPITLTGSFKKANIPIGKTYFIDRLGLVKIIEEYVEIQKSELEKWSHEIDRNELNDFLRRLYKKKQNKSI